MLDRIGNAARALGSHVGDAVDIVRQVATPVARGMALRALDAVGEPRDAHSSVSDRQDGARNTGRGGLRPSTGPGPAHQGVVNDGPGQPGFPQPPAAPASGDGSGRHAAQSPSWKDHIVEGAVYRMADAADGIGLDNAARHMRHYLGNTGETLTFDPAVMMRDIPDIKRAVDGNFQTQVVDAARAKIDADYAGKPMTFSITTPWNGGYAQQGQSRNWFFAVGGFSYAHTATVAVTPGRNGEANVHVASNVHMFDRYNWDGGKSVDIGPVHIEDTAIGRLHTVGLAREFDIAGTAARVDVNFTMRP